MAPKIATSPTAKTAQPEFFRGEPIRKEMEGCTLCFQRVKPRTDINKKTIRKSLAAFGLNPEAAFIKLEKIFVLPEKLREPLIEFFLADKCHQNGTCFLIGKNGGDAVEGIEVKFKTRNNEPYVHATQAIRELAEAPEVFGIVFLESGKYKK